jgi:hypothetical protein
VSPAAADGRHVNDFRVMLDQLVDGYAALLGVRRPVETWTTVTTGGLPAMPAGLTG